MRGCVDGVGLEVIATRIGRTIGALLAQVRRLLPLDERGLPTHLAPARLAELDADGDYDWRAALVARPAFAPWIPNGRTYDREPQPRSSGFAELPDDELVSLVVSMAVSPVTTHPHVEAMCAEEVRMRGLGFVVTQRVHDFADRGLLEVLTTSPTDYSAYGYRPHLAAMPAARDEPDWSAHPY